MSDEEYFKNEGIAIFMKGKMRIGIHPNNLENNCKALDDRGIIINWMDMLNNSDYVHNIGSNKSVKELELVFEDSIMFIGYKCPSCDNYAVEGGSKYCNKCGKNLKNYKFEKNGWYEYDEN